MLLYLKNFRGNSYLFNCLPRPDPYPKEPTRRRGHFLRPCTAPNPKNIPALFPLAWSPPSDQTTRKNPHPNKKSRLLQSHPASNNLLLYWSAGLSRLKWDAIFNSINICRTPACGRCKINSSRKYFQEAIILILLFSFSNNGGIR